MGSRFSYTTTRQGYSREKIVNGLIFTILVTAAILAHITDQPYYINLLSRIVIFSLAGVGLNIALGSGGMVSLGHAAFFGVGGYVAGISATHQMDGTDFLNWPLQIGGTDQLLVVWLVAMLVALIIALFIGIISLRTSGVYFIMITLAFAQMIYYFTISWPGYGGEDGLLISGRNQIPVLDTDNPLVFFLVCFALLSVILFFAARLAASRFGNALEVARMNEVRLATAGIHPFPVKLTAFVLSAMITALAGTLYANLNQFVSPSMLSWHTSGEIIIFVLLGGVGRLFGPVVGAMLFVVLETFLGGMTYHWQLFLGLILLFVVLSDKGGVIGFFAGDKRCE